MIKPYFSKVLRVIALYPTKAIIIAIAITFLLSVISGWTAWVSYRDFNDIYTQEFRLQSLSDKIIHLDEVLTMSARLNAATGDTKWERRYLSFEPQLDAAIKEVIALAPEAYEGDGAKQTDEANIKLVEMEHKSFDLVRQGRKEEALNLLLNSAYDFQKQIYAQGNQISIGAVQNRIQLRLASYRHQLILTGAVTLLSFFVVVPLWILILQIVKRSLHDRKVIQEILQRSEQRARATLLALPDLVFRVNRNGQYIDFLTSPQGECLVDPHDAIGKSMYEALTESITPIQLETIYSVLEQAFVTQTVQIFEQQVWMEGKLRYEEVRVSPCNNDEAVFFVRNISDRKQVELQLLQTNQDLTRATRLKDEFLANMSHELRTPLNAVLGMAEGLQDSVYGEINERQLKALKTIERCGNHLLNLINDILDIAKIESGKMEIDRTICAVAPLCKSSVAFVKQQALKKRIQLEIKLQQNLPSLLVDERWILQVLINLLNNAVKFTPEEGHITLEVTYLPPPADKINLSVSGFPLQDFIQIAVIDTGIGIAPENLNKLFKPFVQIDGALNRKYEGTGLGLALVKRIVELHGGEVDLSSELGVGSRFMVNLPCNTLSLESSDATNHITPELDFTLRKTEEPVEAIKSPVILLAEDNEANISTLSSYLNAKGYRMVLAKNGQEAIDLTKTNHPDLILMDIQMPVLDGLEAIKQLRDDRQFAHIPIIALTALAMPSDRERCLAAGANEYLPKPVKLKQLAMTIQSLISHKLPVS